MRARRFQASTITEAYEQIRMALGDDAVIISTRQATAPGMFGFGKRDFVEVVAGIPEPDEGLRAFADDSAAHDLVRHAAEEMASRGLDIALPSEPPGPVGPPQLASVASGDAALDLAPPFVNAFAGTGLADGPFDVQSRVGVVPRVTVEAPGVETAPANQELLSSLSAGLDDVRSLLQRITLDRAATAVEEGPVALSQVRAELEQRGVALDVLLPVLERVAAALAPSASLAAARQAVGRRLAATLPAPVVPDTARRPGCIFLVGPSGSGKTTNAARLALQFKGQGLRVTIAGIDVDRAGAPQQLLAYGAATGITVQLCYTPGELQALLGERGADIVIVDVPGHNGQRADRMAELQAFAQVARDRALLLTLPATMQASDLLRVAGAYAALRPTGLLLTRCDETEAFGGLVSTVARSGTGISYTAHSDAVDEPLRPGDNRALCHALLNDGWPEPATGFATRNRAV